MAKDRSDKSRYESRFGGGNVTAGQWLAENMCDRVARQKYNKSLPLKFWTIKEWRQKFLYQLGLANRLLKDFTPEAIVSALRTPSGRKVYSFNAKWLLPLLRTKRVRLDSERDRRETRPDPVPPPRSDEQPREGFVAKPSALTKLRELD